jgi:hypothetical protein
MLPPLVSPGNLAILQKAIDEALSLAATQNAELTVNQLADLMCRAYEAGERDPAKLAAAVFSGQSTAAVH